MKITIKLEIPNSGCLGCQYYGYYRKNIPNQNYYVEKHFCKLFNDCELKEINGDFQRCVACQSCTSDELK